MFVWLLHNTILAGLLAIGVALLCRFRRIGPALRHALWLLVLVRLLWPPGVLNWPVEISPRWPAPAAAAEEKAVASKAPLSSSVESVEIVQTAAVGTAAAPAIAAESSMPAEKSVAIPWWIWAGRAVLGIWLLGALLVALKQIRGFIRLWRLRRIGQTASPKLLRWVAELAAKMNLRSPVVRVVPGLASPLVAGLVRPVLLWPEQLEERLGENGLKAVLVHELAHLRRRDHWVRWLEVLAECVWWWNPLFRLARSRVRQYAELACDAWVLAMLPQARRAYAEALVEVCARVSAGRQSVPALGIEGEGDFQRRLTMIMRETVACKLPRRTLLAIAAVALLLLPGFTLGQDKSKATSPAADSKAAEAKPSTDSVWADFDGDGRFALVWQDELYDLQVQVVEGDQKLDDLEARVRALLKEIQALKGKPGEQPETKKQIEMGLQYLRRMQDEKDRAQYRYTTQRAVQALAQARTAKAPPNEVTLLRVTYLLPPGKATVFAGLLKEHVKATPLEANVDGDKLVVTTTPDYQRVLHAVVDLLQERQK
jgi:beta-lactamase regulating signal transducer with metallopeptidase domain